MAKLLDCKNRQRVNAVLSFHFGIRARRFLVGVRSRHIFARSVQLTHQRLNTLILTIFHCLQFLDAGGKNREFSFWDFRNTEVIRSGGWSGSRFTSWWICLKLIRNNLSPFILQHNSPSFPVVIQPSWSTEYSWLTTDTAEITSWLVSELLIKRYSISHSR